jgi:hypothetical protein
MRRWSNIAAVGGFLLVLAFAAERFLHVRVLWAGLSWTDLRRAGHDLWLVVVIITAIFLATFRGIGYLLWRTIRPIPPKTRLAEPQYSFSGRWRYTVRVGVLAVALGITAEFLTGMRTPGALTRHVIFKLDIFAIFGVYLTLAFHFLTPIVVDSVTCFAILWGGYLLWKKGQWKAAQGTSSISR